MYLKCPIHHVLLELTDELVKQAKTKHLIGIKRFQYESNPVTGNHRYKVSILIDNILIHAMYLKDNKWSIRVS